MKCIMLLALFFIVPLAGAEVEKDSANAAVDTVLTDTTVQVEVGSSDTLPDSTSTAGDLATENASDRVQSAEMSKTSTDTIDEKKVQVTEKKDVATTSSVKKIKLRKRQYNYKQQIRLAVGMMAFIAVMMMTAQNFNPK